MTIQERIEEIAKLPVGVMVGYMNTPVRTVEVLEQHYDEFLQELTDFQEEVRLNGDLPMSDLINEESIINYAISDKLSSILSVCNNMSKEVLALKRFGLTDELNSLTQVPYLSEDLTSATSKTIIKIFANALADLRNDDVADSPYIKLLLRGVITSFNGIITPELFCEEFKIPMPNADSENMSDFLLEIHEDYEEYVKAEALNSLRQLLEKPFEVCNIKEMGKLELEATFKDISIELHNSITENNTIPFNLTLDAMNNSQDIIAELDMDKKKRLREAILTFESANEIGRENIQGQDVVIKRAISLPVVILGMLLDLSMSLQYFVNNSNLTADKYQDLKIEDEDLETYLNVLSECFENFSNKKEITINITSMYGYKGSLYVFSNPMLRIKDSSLVQMQNNITNALAEHLNIQYGEDM